ncbi:uncharacterized protein BDZ99DRAFT_230394 [Mytilinidion resinicola]|uniref:Uncharacterized protein n=1 Tax=Mytilinidion resinicola TaxID=574789 RepID=A0A6A6Z005_9PEZI|nr:uncharacterized protein BDZ99DRAFT_230394 [Mytilinidion resinicola]KAF2814033.1 hypothetical protein BDZ99DRAFT_230394 [Mytilinidion resinicola]
MWGKSSYTLKCELGWHLIRLAVTKSCGSNKLTPTTTCEEKYQVLAAGQVVWVGEMPSIALLFAGKGWSYSILIHYANSVCNDVSRIDHSVSGSQRKLIEPSYQTSYENAAMTVPSVVCDHTLGTQDHIAGDGDLQHIELTYEAEHTNQNTVSLGSSSCSTSSEDSITDILSPYQNTTAFTLPVENDTRALHLHAWYTLKWSQLEEACCTIWRSVFQGPVANNYVVLDESANLIYLHLDNFLNFFEKVPRNSSMTLAVLLDDSLGKVQEHAPIFISFVCDSAKNAGGWTLDRLLEESTYESLAEAVCVVVPLLTASTYCAYNVSYWAARGLFGSSKWVWRKAFPADITIEATSAFTLSMPGQFPTPASPNSHDDYAPWASASQTICWGVRKGCWATHKVVAATVFTIKSIPKWVGALWAWWNDKPSTPNSPDTSNQLFLQDIEYPALLGTFPQDAAPVPSFPQPSLSKISPSKVTRTPSFCRLSTMSMLSPFNSGTITSVC